MYRALFGVTFLAAAVVACSGASDQSLFAGAGSSGASGNTSSGTSGASGNTSGGTSGASGNTSSGSSGTPRDAGEGDANGILDASCGTRASAASRQPTYLYVVLDGSGSMFDGSKWTSAQAAMQQIIDDFRTQADRSLGVGMMIFSDTLDPTAGAGPYPTAKDVGVAFVDSTQHDLLRARIDTAQPSASTPTLAALQGAYSVMENLVVGAPLPPNGRKVVVLMTDGVPSDSSQTQCTALAATELGKGITTFVVGVGPFPTTSSVSYDPVFLGGLANAGGAAPAGCNPKENTDVSKVCFTQITPGADVTKMKQSFVDALNKIRAVTTSCELAINGSIDPTKFNVAVKSGTGTETVIGEGGPNGWSFDTLPPTKVVLHGAACDRLKYDPQATASFIQGCATIKN